MMDFEWRLSIDTVQLSSWLSIQFQAPRFKSWISRSNSFKERPPTLEPSPPPQCILKSVPCLFMNLLTTSAVIEFYTSVTAPIYQRSKLLAMGLFLIVWSWCSNLWHNAVPYYNISSPCLFEASYNRNHWFYHLLSLVGGSYWRHL